MFRGLTTPFDSARRATSFGGVIPVQTDFLRGATLWANKCHRRLQGTTASALNLRMGPTTSSDGCPLQSTHGNGSTGSMRPCKRSASATTWARVAPPRRWGCACGSTMTRSSTKLRQGELRGWKASATCFVNLDQATSGEAASYVPSTSPKNVFMTRKKHTTQHNTTQHITRPNDEQTLSGVWVRTTTVESVLCLRDTHIHIHTHTHTHTHTGVVLANAGETRARTHTHIHTYIETPDESSPGGCWENVWASSYYRMCSLTTKCVLLLQNVFSYYRAFSYYRLKNVFFYD